MVQRRQRQLRSRPLTPGTTEHFWFLAVRGTSIRVPSTEKAIQPSRRQNAPGNPLMMPPQMMLDRIKLIALDLAAGLDIALITFAGTLYARDTSRLTPCGPEKRSLSVATFEIP